LLPEEGALGRTRPNNELKKPPSARRKGGVKSGENPQGISPGRAQARWIKTFEVRKAKDRGALTRKRQIQLQKTVPLKKSRSGGKKNSSENEIARV